MGIIHIPYIILEQGEAKNLLKDREKNSDIFDGCDDETLLEYIEKYEHYYKAKFPKYPKVGIDIDGLCKWAEQNNYISLATDEEKTKIKWDGTKKHLFEKGKNGFVVPRVFLKKRLIKWAESKQIKDSKTGLLTEDSPIIPNLSLFYKKIEDGPDRYEWIFPCEIENTQAYYYTRTTLIDTETYKPIEPKMI
tara:strand:+ start:63 stop:638 length:576 start_codon:yes stop_codon:yes gene_type:complete